MDVNSAGVGALGYVVMDPDSAIPPNAFFQKEPFMKSEFDTQTFQVGGSIHHYSNSFQFLCL